MMSGAVIFVAAVLASAFASERGDTARKTAPPPRPALPPLRVIVEASTGIRGPLVDRTLTEAAAIWRSLGVTIEWDVPDPAHASNGGPGAEEDCAVPHVAITDEVNTVPGGRTVLGWIMFTSPDAPDHVIHVSRAGASWLMATTPRVREAPLVLQDRLIARALGRALAHELGHYLLGPGHTARGLMQGTRPAQDFFSIERRGFDLAPEQLDALTRHVKMTPPS
jgi:hypothetical protein